MRLNRRWPQILILSVLVSSFLLEEPVSVVAVINEAVFDPIKDTYIEEDRQDRNNGGSQVLEIISRAGNPARNNRAAVAFDISSIPPGATVERAGLWLSVINPEAANRNYEVHRLTESWLEGTGNSSVNNPTINGMTWIERLFGDNVWTGGGTWDWTQRGGDFVAAPTASTPTPSTLSWFSWDVSTDVVAWYGGAPNYGWLLKDAAENGKGNNRTRFASRENGNQALAPKLRVAYLRGDAAISTNTVEAGWYGPLRVSLTNTAGPGGDQLSRATFTIPAGWSQISSNPADYMIAVPGKSWAVATAPGGPDGPQTLVLAANTPADDLAAGETIDITFSVRAPWMTGTSQWQTSLTGAAGGTHRPLDLPLYVFGGALNSLPGGDQNLMPVVLSGMDATATGNLGLIEIIDARGTGAGWSLTLAATDFIRQSGTETISASNFIVPSPPTVTTVSGLTPPVTAGGSLAGPGFTVINAAGGAGAGHYQITPALELLVPAQALAGTYTTTVTETVVGGL